MISDANSMSYNLRCSQATVFLCFRDDFETSQNELYPLNQDFFFTEKEIPHNYNQEFYQEFARETDQFGTVSNKMASLRMDSSVIY